MMKISNVIEIQLSKTKLFFSLLGAIIFAGIGFWLIAIEPPETFYLKFFGLLKFTITNTKLFFACLGLLVILIFGSFAFLTLKKIRDNLPGLIITRDGITDNSNAASVGFIPWEDVIKIKETKISRQKFISIIVKDPQSYIKKQKSAFRRKTMQINCNMCGTPVSISANSLKFSYKELKAILEKKFSEFNETNHHVGGGGN